MKYKWSSQADDTEWYIYQQRNIIICLTQGMGILTSKINNVFHENLLQCCFTGRCPFSALHWRHNECNGISNHQPNDCLLNILFRCRSKKTTKLRVTGLWAGNSLVTGEFPAQRASNTENVSIWWRHHAQGTQVLSYWWGSANFWDEN